MRSFDPSWSGPVGVDVSSHQGEIDWPAFAAAGVSFAYIKATEGLGFVDPRFRANVDGARAAGLIVGLYHFARPDKRAQEPAGVVGGGAAEARALVAAAQSVGLVDALGLRQPGVLPLVLDLEWGGCEGVGKAAVTDYACAFDEAVRDEVTVYTGPNFVRYKTDSARLRHTSLWVVSYTHQDRPRADIPGWPWRVWQWSCTYPRPDGPDRKIDANRYRGSMDELRAWANC